MEDYSKIDLGLLYANHYRVAMICKLFNSGSCSRRIEMDISFRRKKPYIVYKVCWNDYDDNGKYVSLQKAFDTLLVL